MNDEIVCVTELKNAIEAILFVSSKPVNIETLIKILPINGNKNLLEQALKELIEEYNSNNRGVFIREVAGGYQIASKEKYGEIINKYFAHDKKKNLSRHALETLAIIAYKQPITLAEISELRGKNSAHAIKSLLEKKLIKISGRKNVIGKPFLYSTTSEFLILFGLKNLSELPKITEFNEYFDENTYEYNKEDAAAESIV
jgi:segregation and condensation protein B